MKNKYDIYIDEKNKKVIAVCRYGGRKVRATATCAPEDTFDIAFGTNLAIARCEVKVAKMKIQRASAKYLEASVAADAAQKRYDDMKQYYMDSIDQFDAAIEAHNKLIDELN